MTRRGRHIPRLCRTCDAPLGGQDDTCWHCGAVWVDHDGRDDEPGGLSGAVLSDIEERGAIMAAEPSADDAELVRRA